MGDNELYNVLSYRINLLYSILAVCCTIHVRCNWTGGPYLIGLG